MLGSGGHGLADQSAHETTSVNPSFVGVEHVWNVVSDRESRFEAAAHLGPCKYLDPIVPAGQQTSCFQERPCRCRIVCPAQVAARMPPRVVSDGPGELTVRRHAGDVQVEV